MAPAKGRHALLGCGRVADNHADAVRATPGWELGPLCDVKVDRAQALAERWAAPSVTDTAAAVLDDPGVTSVSILTDHASHPRWVEAALMAGKHVLVEKPLAFSAERAASLAQLAADRGLVLMTVSQHQYDAAVQSVRDWLREGLLGEVVLVRVALEARREDSYYATSDWHGTWELEGGSALVNQGYHCLDVVRGLVGPLQVVSSTGTLAPADATQQTEVTVAALLRSADARPVIFSVTTASSTRWRTRIEVVGTRGTVEFDTDHPARIQRVSGDPDLLHAAAQVVEEAATDTPGIDYYGISHRRQFADFAQSVTTGHLTSVPASDGVEMAGLIASIYRGAGLPGGPAQ